MNIPHPVLRQVPGAPAPQKIKILISGKLHDRALEILSNPPPELRVGLPLELVVKPDCPRDVLFQELQDTHVLISRSETDVDLDVLRAGKSLSVVARAAVGFGNIDCDAATEMGILVLNTPGKNTNSAAELTVGLLLCAIRHIHKAHTSTSQGGWNRHQFTGTELGGRTLGLLGLGNVGHRVAKFARGFDMRVVAFDPYLSDDIFRKYGCERKSSIEMLLAESDVLSVHTPLNKETKNIIREIELRKMRRGSIVVNAARGGIISETGLLACLNDGHIAAAGIDTWLGEPAPLKELVSHQSVVSTPHIGASTEEAQVRIAESVAVQVLKALRGEIVDSPVNLPHISVFGLGAAKTYAVLTERISRMAAQLLDFQPVQLRLEVAADLKKSDLELLRLATMKGFLADTAEDFVSYVNAEQLFTKRGLSLVVEDVVAGSGVARGTIAAPLTLQVQGAAAHQQLSLGAALYDGQLQRLVRFNDFDFETEPTGDILVIKNHDRPGVVGDVGCYLARHGINIAQFELSRNRQGGMAMALIKLDGGATPEVVSGLVRLPHVIFARQVSGL